MLSGADPLLPAATKLGQGNVFTPVCDSVNRGGGVPGLVPGGIPGRHPPDQVHPPGIRYTPQDQVHPPGTRYTPLGPGTPPRTRYTPPDQVHPPGPGTPPRTRYTPQDQVHPLGPGTPPTPGTLPRDQVHPPRNTANERPVRILLECILVFNVNPIFLKFSEISYGINYLCFVSFGESLALAQCWQYLSNLDVVDERFSVTL